MFVNRHIMCKCVHFQISVIKTPVRDQCLWKERRKKGWVEKEITLIGCNYGKGHTSSPQTVSKSESPGSLEKTQMAGSISRIPESTGLGWVWKFIFLTNSRWCWRLFQVPHFENHCVISLHAHWSPMPTEKSASDAGISVKVLIQLLV